MYVAMMFSAKSFLFSRSFPNGPSSTEPEPVQQFKFISVAGLVANTDVFSIHSFVMSKCPRKRELTLSFWHLRVASDQHSPTTSLIDSRHAGPLNVCWTLTCAVCSFISATAAAVFRLILTLTITIWPFWRYSVAYKTDRTAQFSRS